MVGRRNKKDSHADPHFGISAAQDSGQGFRVPDLDDARTFSREEALQVLRLGEVYTLPEANRAFTDAYQAAQSASEQFRVLQSFRTLEQDLRSGPPAAALINRTEYSRDKPFTPPAGVSIERNDAAPNIDALAAALRVDYARIASEHDEQAEEREKGSFEPLARALRFAQFLLADPKRIDDYCKKHSLERDGRSSRNPFHLPIKGLFPKNEWVRRRSLITQHADVLFALDDAGLRPAEVVQWLNNPDDTDGDNDGPRGFEKAQAHNRNSKRWRDLGRKTAQDRLAQRERLFNETMKELRAVGALGEILGNQRTAELPDGCHGIGVFSKINGVVKLFEVTTDEAAVRSTVVQKGAHRSSGSRRGKARKIASA